MTKVSLVVVAAGNGGYDVTEFGPAGVDRALTVASTDKEDNIAPFSNWGETVDIAAPGVEVLGPRAAMTELMRGALGFPDGYLPGGNFVGQDGTYVRASGTSFSAPIVAGAASLLLSVDPSLTNRDVERRLVQSADDVDVPGRDNYSGYGLLNVSAAINSPTAFFVDSVITDVGVLQNDDGVFVRVTGTAAADEFDAAYIEIGAGENPEEWKPVSGRISRSIVDGVLGDIEAANLAGSSQWTIRLVTVHKNGRQREARFLLNVG